MADFQSPVRYPSPRTNSIRQIPGTRQNFLTVIITPYNVCSVPWGGGGGGGGREMLSAMEEIMSTMEDILSTVGMFSIVGRYHDKSGGYLECHGRYNEYHEGILRVPWGVSWVPWGEVFWVPWRDIVINVGGYCRGCSVPWKDIIFCYLSTEHASRYSWYPLLCIMISPTLLIPPDVSWYSSTFIMVSPYGTVHPHCTHDIFPPPPPPVMNRHYTRSKIYCRERPMDRLVTNGGRYSERRLRWFEREPQQRMVAWLTSR